jgi:hypothetical protein
MGVSLLFSPPLESVNKAASPYSPVHEFASILLYLRSDLSGSGRFRW